MTHIDWKFYESRIDFVVVVFVVIVVVVVVLVVVVVVVIMTLLLLLPSSSSSSSSMSEHLPQSIITENGKGDKPANKNAKPTYRDH